MRLARLRNCPTAAPNKPITDCIQDLGKHEPPDEASLNLVVQEDEHEICAIKILNKDKIIRSKQHLHLRNEIGYLS